ncbi:ABC transporter substrate-binding protein [Pseudomonas sp. NBRC 111119]|uniref:substrate-binding periplasmic protein n=1 Tax=Pseudomonas sp. NBRC 111119 TaxID=1661034 RepID=UPI00076207EB|nr:transporter substrate-binding domain-containing protein [Pseudomonas sp. NBRC 111119]
MTPAPGLKALSTLLLFAAIWLAAPAWAAEQVEVRVGAAHFPPYTVRPEQGAGAGLLVQLIDALNRLQPGYRFVLVPTSVQRRFSDLKQGRTDMAIFENPQWGWAQVPHQAVDMGLEDAEVFVARTSSAQSPGYFDDLRGKRLALFNGYHYAFAGFNPDPGYLRHAFNATLTYSHDSNLLMVQAGRADIALVTRSFFNDFIARNPASRAQLLASQRIDQLYHHYALLRPGAPIPAQSFARLLQVLRDNGQLGRIFEPYGIQLTPELH